jgi:hypothetical protein
VKASTFIANARETHPGLALVVKLLEAAIRPYGWALDLRQPSDKPTVFKASRKSAGPGDASPYRGAVLESEDAYTLLEGVRSFSYDEFGFDLAEAAPSLLTQTVEQLVADIEEQGA